MFIDTKETTSFLDLTKPSLAALSHILRRRHLWPAGFEWHYTCCATCAMGMAHRLWEFSGRPSVISAARVMGSAFGIDAHNVHRIFLGKAFPKNEYFDVTPEMVADKIDEYLGQGMQS